MSHKIGFIFDSKNDWIQKHLSGLNWLPDYHKRYTFIESFEQKNVSNIDVLFILGFTQILPKKFLESNGLNLVVHESELPLGKGFSPVQWQLLAGANEIPVRLIEAVTEVDAGDIYGKTTMKLAGNELMGELRLLQVAATKQLIISFLNNFPAVIGYQQEGESSYYRKRNREDDRLDPDKTLRQQFNQLRIADNDVYPAFFEINGFKYYLKIEKVQKYE